MRFDTLVCLDDLLRDSYWPAKEFIYDLIRVPVFQASGLHIGKSPRRGQASNLLSGFDLNRFLALVGPAGADTAWTEAYHRFSAAAADELARHLPPRALVLGYEMTPALRSLLDQRGLAWLDIRLAPLRFASDLYLALRTNRPELYAAVHAHSVDAMEVASEASLLAARLRYRRRYEPRDSTLDGLWVYIGQTEADASLLDADGRFVRAEDHAATLRTLAAQGALQYKPHPLAGEFARREHLALERLAGRALALCPLDTYELLCAEENVSLVGISSGTLQEAAWFGRQAYTLIPPLCELRFDPGFDAGRYQLVASHRFMSSPLWAAVVDAPAGERCALQLPAQASRLRELHNTWWGYSTAQLRHNSFQQEAFALAGGDAQAAALARTEAELRRTRADLEELRAEFAQWRAGLAQGGPATGMAADGHHLPMRPLPRMPAL